MEDSTDVNQPIEELMGKIDELNSITSSNETSIIVQKNKEMLDSLLSKVQNTEFEIKKMQEKFKSYDEQISKTNKYVTNEIMKMNEKIDYEIDTNIKGELKKINEDFDSSLSQVETIRSEITVIQKETNTKIEEKVAEIYARSSPIEELNELRSLVLKLQEQTTFLSEKEIKKIKEEVESIKKSTTSVQNDFGAVKESLQNMGDKYDKEISEVKDSVEVIKKNGDAHVENDDELYARIMKQIRSFIDLVKVIIIALIALFLAVVNP